MARTTKSRIALEAAFAAIQKANAQQADFDNSFELWRGLTDAYEAVAAVSAHLDAPSIVASALYAYLYEQDIKETHPTCVGGGPYLVFFRATKEFLER